MKLFEFADLGNIRSILSVLKGLADRKEIPSELNFATFKNYIDGDEEGIGNPESLVAVKDKVDPAGDVIQSVDDEGTVTLNTKVKKPYENLPRTGGGKGLDQMASHAVKDITG